MNIRDSLSKHLADLMRQLQVLPLYDRFQHLVAITLTFIITIIVLVALWRLAWDVSELLLLKSFDPLNHEVFQRVFGGIMTLLIAMEFKHSIIVAAKRKENIIQVKTVLLVALLALSRKFIVMDINTVTAGKIASLGGALLALGCVYWLILAGERSKNGNNP